MDTKYFDIFPPYISTEKLIYHADPTGDRYKIDVYDYNGKKIQSIRKNCRQLPFSKEEKEGALERFNYVKDDQRFKSFPYKYKKQVNFIIPEIDNRIWVLSSLERNKTNQDLFHANIFDKGIFQNSVNIKGKLDVQDFHFRNMKYKIKNNRFYQYSGHEDKISVFEIVKG